MSLVTRNLRKRYDTDRAAVAAVRDVNLEIVRGEIYTLLGPSGCGKTTTLRCIAGLETPDEGEIAYGAIFAALDALGYDGWIGCEYKPRAGTDEGLAWVRKLGVEL